MIDLLYLVPSLYNPGGMERILTEKINFLVETSNYKVTVITTDQNNLPIYFKLSSKVNVIHLNLDFNAHFDKNVFEKYLVTKKILNKYKLYLEQYIQFNNIDICISLGGKELEFFYKLKVNCKKVCELHFSQGVRKQFLTSRSSSFIWKKIGDYRTQQLINQTKKLDKLVVLTKADERIWKKTHNNLVQIYNFSPIETDKLGLLNKKQVLAMGRLDAQKGFDLLIDTWEIVHKKNPDWILNIYGQGEWKEILEKKIKNKSLQKKIFLKGVTSNVEEVMLEHSIFVLSSRYEGFAMVLLESISCGVPIVSFDCKTGPSEIITDNDCGFLAKDQDIKHLANGINKLINNESLRTNMGKNAKEKSHSFSKEYIMSQWDTLFKEITNYENTN